MIKYIMMNSSIPILIICRLLVFKSYNLSRNNPVGLENKLNKETIIVITRNQLIDVGLMDLSECHLASDLVMKRHMKNGTIFSVYNIFEMNIIITI